MDERIQCGKCNSTYSPRIKEDKLDYSCPVCQHGSMKEVENSNMPKKMLLDWRAERCN